MLGIDRQVQNQVGTEAFGNYFALFNLAFIFNFLLDLGLSTYNSQRIASDKQNASEAFTPITSLKLILGLVYALLLFSVGIISGVSNISLLLILGLSQFLFSIFIFLRSTITALQMFRSDAMLSVLDKGLMIIMAGALIYFPNLAGSITIERFAWIQVIAILISILVALIIILKHHKINFKVNLDLALLKKALPYAFVVLCMSAMNRQDAYLLERIHENGAYEAGLYASAYRLLDACNMIGYLFAVFLLPFIAKNIANRTLVIKTLAVSRNVLLLISIAIATLCWIFKSEVHSILYNDSTSYAALLLGILMLSLPGYFLVQVYGTYLTATGQVNKFLRISLIFMLVNLTLNIYFIPRYGAFGSSVISVTTQILYGVWLFYTSKMQLRDSLSND